MPYVYENAEELEGGVSVGTRQCVALVKHYTNAPPSSLWREGEVVKGNLALKKGTVIATFVNGKYQNLSHGNHAAFYLSQNTHGIDVVDQWSSSKTVRRRLLAFKGKDKGGKYVTPSDNGDAFSVVE